MEEVDSKGMIDTGFLGVHRRGGCQRRQAMLQPDDIVPFCTQHFVSLICVGDKLSQTLPGRSIKMAIKNQNTPLNGILF